MGGILMMHLHITSWVIAIILFFVTYFSYKANHEPTRANKPLHMTLRLFMVLVLFSGVWLLIQEFSSGTAGSGHMLLTLKMLCGIAVVALMEITLTRKVKRLSHTGLFWGTIIAIVVTMALGIFLPGGPISNLFGF